MSSDSSFEEEVVALLNTCIKTYEYVDPADALSNRVAVTPSQAKNIKDQLSNMSMNDSLTGKGLSETLYGSSGDGLVVKRAKDYLRVFNGSKDKSVHMTFFREIFQNLFESILRDDDKWISDKKCQIIVSKNGKRGNAHVMIYIIYGKAVEISDSIKKQGEAMGAGDAFASGRQEFIYPQLIKLYLYRIFVMIAPEEYKEKLESIIVDYEIQVGLKEETKGEVKDENPMAGMLQYAAGFAQKAGIQMDTSELKNYDMNAVNNYIGKTFGSDKMKSTLGNLAKVANTPGLSTEDKLVAVVNEVTTSGLIEDMKKDEAFMKTSSSSSNSSIPMSKGLQASLEATAPEQDPEQDVALVELG